MAHLRPSTPTRRKVRVVPVALLAGMAILGLAPSASAAISVDKSFATSVQAGGLALQTSTGNLFVYDDGGTIHIYDQTGATKGTLAWPPLGGCTGGVLACVELKNGDAACLTKAQATCAKNAAKIPALATSLAANIAKSCATAPLAPGDLLAPAGLDFGDRASVCIGLGVTSLTTVADIATCVQRQHECRVDQLLENETPRLRELLGLGHVALP